MNFIQRWFNRVVPLDSDTDLRPGAAGFHPDIPWMDYAARIHDLRDSCIRKGLLEMTYRENDEDFNHLLSLVEQQYHFLNNLDRRQAELKDKIAENIIIPGYRDLRGEK